MCMCVCVCSLLILFLWRTVSKELYQGHISNKLQKKKIQPRSVFRPWFNKYHLQGKRVTTFILSLTLRKALSWLLDKILVLIKL